MTSDDELILWWGLVHEGYAAVSSLIREDIEFIGLPVAWFEVLLRLSRSPEHRLPMTQLAGEVAFSSGGFTKLADRLVTAGLVKRRPCPIDGRVTWVSLTPKGRRKITEAVERHSVLLRERVLAVLGADDFARLGGIMRTLRDAARDVAREGVPAG